MPENFDLFPQEKKEADKQAEKAETSGREKRQKSPHAYRTISEVADELGVASHVLRFWESKFNAIKPMKRGGGRRYYRPEDVEVLKKIRHLLYEEGYTIKGVQSFLKRGGTSVDAPGVAASELGHALNELRAIRKMLDE